MTTNGKKSEWRLSPKRGSSWRLLERKAWALLRLGTGHGVLTDALRAIGRKR